MYHIKSISHVPISSNFVIDSDDGELGEYKNASLLDIGCFDDVGVDAAAGLLYWLPNPLLE